MDFFGLKPKAVVGIEISDSSICVVRLVKRLHKVEVTHRARLGLPHGLVLNGEVQKPRAMVRAIKTALHRTHPEPLDVDEVVVALPDSFLYTHVFDVGVVEDEEALADLVEQEVLTTIPVSQNNLNYVFSPIAEDNEGQSILVVGGQKEHLRRWHKVFKKAGLTVNFFDAQALAVHRGVYKEYGDEPVMIVDIGAKISTITVHAPEGPVYTYTLHGAGFEMDERIAHVKKITHKEARHIKHVNGLLGDRETRDAIVREMSRIALAIIEAYAYVHERGLPSKFPCVFVGGVSRMRGLREYMLARIKQDVQIGHIDWIEPKLPLSYVGAVGVARKELLQQRHPDPVLKEHEEREFLSLKHLFSAYRGNTTKGIQKPRNARVWPSSPQSATRRVRTHRGPLEYMLSHKVSFALGVVVLGIVIIMGIMLQRFIHERNEQELLEQQQAERLGQVSTVVEVALPVALEEEEYDREVIRGRILENTVQSAVNYGNAVAQSRELARAKLKEGEVLWITPMFRQDEVYPMRLKWFAYHEDDMKRLVQERLAEVQDGDFDFAIDLLIPQDWEYLYDSVEWLAMKIAVTVLADKEFNVVNEEVEEIVDEGEFEDIRESTSSTPDEN